MHTTAYYFLMNELKEEFPREAQRIPEALKPVLEDYTEYIHALRKKYKTAV